MLCTIIMMAVGAFAASMHDDLDTMRSSLAHMKEQVRSDAERLEERVRQNEINAASVEQQLRTIQAMLIEIKAVVEDLRGITSKS